MVRRNRVLLSAIFATLGVALTGCAAPLSRRTCSLSPSISWKAKRRRSTPRYSTIVTRRRSSPC